MFSFAAVGWDELQAENNRFTVNRNITIRFLKQNMLFILNLVAEKFIL